MSLFDFTRRSLLGFFHKPVNPDYQIVCKVKIEHAKLFCAPDKDFKKMAIPFLAEGFNQTPVFFGLFHDL